MSNPFPDNSATGSSNPFGPQQQAPQQPPQPAHDDEFDQPEASGDQINAATWRSYVGSLLLFDVHGWRENVQTENGLSDAAVADVHVIDVNGGPFQHYRVMVFTNAVRDKLKNKALAGGGSVLGRLKLVQSKTGSRDYVDLDPHTEQDKQMARQYREWLRNQNFEPSQPAQVQEEPPF